MLRVLFAERLDLVSALYALAKLRSYEKIYFVSRSPIVAGRLPALLASKLERITYEGDPGAVFPNKKYAVFLTERLFDAEFPPALRALIHSYARSLFGVDAPELLDLYFKKLLYERLIEKVRAHFFLRRLRTKPELLWRLSFLPDGMPDFSRYMERHDEYDAKPVDDRSVAQFLAESFPESGPQVEVPRSWRLLAWARDLAVSLASIAAYAAATALFLLARLFRSAPEKAAAKYAVRWIGPITWARSEQPTIFHHFLFYGDLSEAGDFNPENILLLLNPKDVTASDRDKLRRGGYRCLDLGAPCGVDRRFALHVLLRLPGLAWRLAGWALSGRLPSPYAVQGALKLVYTMTVQEHEASRIDCRFYKESTEYSSDSILKTLILNKRGITTFNLCHGDHFVHTEATSYVYLNRFFIWSRRQVEIFGRAWRHFDRLTVLGPFKNDFFRRPPAPENAVALARADGLYRVTLFDTTFSPEFHNNAGDIRRMYEDILDVLETIPGTFTIIKSKLHHRGRIFTHKGFEAIGERVAAMKNCFVMEPSYPPQEAFKFSDLVVVFGFSTVGVEALCCGRAVLFYDPPRLKEHPFLKYPGVVCHDKESLRRRIVELKNGAPYMPPEALEAMIAHEGRRRPSYARFFVEDLNRPSDAKVVE